MIVHLAIKLFNIRKAKFQNLIWLRRFSIPPYFPNRTTLVAEYAPTKLTLLPRIFPSLFRKKPTINANDGLKRLEKPNFHNRKRAIALLAVRKR